jgi:hypothetical protein
MQREGEPFRHLLIPAEFDEISLVVRHRGSSGAERCQVIRMRTAD